MIVNQGKEYYPLGFGRLVREDKVYYDRTARQKSWFYLDLRGTARKRFVPSGSDGLVTAAGETFTVR